MNCSPNEKIATYSEKTDNVGAADLDRYKITLAVVFVASADVSL
jgi:hypothetical protein